MKTQWTPREDVRIGPYVLKRCLGQGGNGQVWLAWKDNPTGTPMPCVIKFPLHRYANDPRAAEQFLAEGGMAMRMNMHANTVHVIDVGVFKGMPYIAMEFVDGASLHKLLHHARARHRRVSLPAIYHTLASIASALHHAHFGASKAGKPIKLVHRDIKPGNVLINHDGLVKLADFGISAFLDDDHSGVHLRGTSRYMSPEHVRLKVRPEMDIYALGIIGWELIENRIYRVECNGEEHYQKILDGDIPPMYSTDVPERLKELIMRCLDVNPRQRPLALELIEGLKLCEGYSRDPDMLAAEIREMLGHERPSWTTHALLAATPELLATLAVLDPELLGYSPTVDPSDPTPPEPDDDSSDLTVARPRPSEADGVAGKLEPEPIVATPVSTTQKLGPPAAVVRRADSAEASRTEKIPAPSTAEPRPMNRVTEATRPRDAATPSSTPPDRRSRWASPAALALSGALASLAIALLVAPLMVADGDREVGPAREVADSAASAHKLAPEPNVAPPEEGASLRAAPTAASWQAEADGTVVQAPAAKAPATSDSTEAAPIAGETEPRPPAPEREPAMSDSTETAPIAGETEPRPPAPEREKATPTIAVKIVLDFLGGQATVKIGARTVKVDGKGADIKVTRGKHRVRWRIGTDPAWHDAGRHQFNARHYLIRVQPSELRVIEID